MGYFINSNSLYWQCNHLSTVSQKIIQSQQCTYLFNLNIGIGVKS